jgi:hypothetical protein
MALGTAKKKGKKKNSERSRLQETHGKREEREKKHTKFERPKDARFEVGLCA